MKTGEKSPLDPTWKRSSVTTYGSVQLPERKLINCWKLFSSLGLYGRFKFAIGSVAAILHGAVSPLFVLLFGITTNHLLAAIPSRTFYNSEMIDILHAYVILAAAIFVFSTIQAASFESVSGLIVYHLKLKYLRSVFINETKWLDRQRVENLTSKLTTNMDAIKDGSGLKFSLLLQNSAALICSCAVGFYCNWKLTLLLFLFMPLLQFATTLSGKLSSTASSGEQHRLVAATRVVERIFTAFSTVLTFGGQERSLKEYEKELNDAAKANERNLDHASLANGAVFIVMYTSYGFMLWLGSMLFLGNQILPGYVFTVIFIGMGVSNAIGNLVTLYDSLENAKFLAQPVFEVIESSQGISCPIKALPNPKFMAQLQLIDIYFSYPLKAQHQVLSRLTFDVIPGSSVGIIGDPGSGKTTILNLLLRFYSPMQGRILLDNMDLQEYPCDYIRSQIAILAQNPNLFTGTIAQNIQIGGLGLNVEEAARQAEVADFIWQLPDQYETVIGDKGQPLPLVQLRRIALARALISQPRILILDDPTSNLDLREEKAFLKTLDALRRNRTMITLTRTPSVVQLADVIHFLKDGQIVESGRYEQLMRKGEEYFRYVQTHARLPTIKEDSLKEAEGNISKPPASTSSNGKTQEKKSLTAGDLRTKLCRLMRPEWASLLLGFFAAALMALVLPTSAFFYGEIIRVFSGPRDQLSSGGMNWTLAFTLLGVFAFIATALRTKLLGRSSELIGKTLRCETLRASLSLPLSSFDSEQNFRSEILRKLIRDVGILRSAYTLRALFLFVIVVTLVSSLVLAYISAREIALVLTLSLPLLVASSYVETMTLCSTNQDHPKDELSLRLAVEAIGQIRTVQSLVAEAQLLYSYKKHLQRELRKTSWHSVGHILTFALAESALCLVYALAFYCGATWLDSKLFVLPDFYTALLAVVFCGGSLGQIVSILPDHSKAIEAAKSIMTLIEMKSTSTIDPFSDTGARNELQGALILSDVHFSYPTDLTKIFNGLEVEVKAKQTLGLIAKKRSGKTSICKLVERFYDVDSGAVVIDGWDVRDLNVAFLRANIGFVSEEVPILDMSILNNIAYGALDDPSYEQVLQAARTANVHDFIMLCPQGYDTLVGNGGVELSLGQKLRIGLARALIRNPKILLLDLPNVEVGSKNEERALEEAIDSARQNRTTVILTNRVVTVQKADVIGILKNGRIIEFGTPQELLAQEGIYRKLQIKGKM